jgi:uncharacterized SAM-binding protein YcdF (DUF218 family)
LKPIPRFCLVLFAAMTVVQIVGCLSSKKRISRQFAEGVAAKPIDVLIVPGVPFKGGHWDSVMKARVIWSYALYKNGIVKNVIYSGSAVYSPYYEGVVMGLYAEQLGIPKEHILCETLARHSTENVYYAYLMAQHHGFKSIALGTDPFQSYMLQGFTRKRFTSHIYHMPFDTDTLKKYNYLDPHIDPSSAGATDFVAITDKESFWRRLRGTFGKDIDWSRYEGGKVGKL